ncbi:putative lipoprotein [Geomonas sp.]|uniref:putative lipoprotein n=1 Tax=Geomonas sp. TaxID=2651584 RepID=UPI002B473CA4|nr:putative lipoprotein [Geomonas sp.]HJV34210.1 putative lipoprotein [Geomonas sp.]
MSTSIHSKGRSVVRTLQITGAAGIVLAMFGCSISDSVSDSVSSPFKWSSDSSRSSSHDKESYQRDIRDYTEAYVRSSADVQGFRSGLASIAEKHGISNWEADSATYKGIGQGLGRAKVKQAQLEVYKANIASGNATYASAMQDGYDQYRN